MYTEDVSWLDVVPVPYLHPMGVRAPQFKGTTKGNFHVHNWPLKG